VTIPCPCCKDSARPGYYLDDDGRRETWRECTCCKGGLVIELPDPDAERQRKAREAAQRRAAARPKRRVTRPVGYLRLPAGTKWTHYTDAELAVILDPGLTLDQVCERIPSRPRESMYRARLRADVCRINRAYTPEQEAVLRDVTLTPTEAARKLEAMGRRVRVGNVSKWRVKRGMRGRPHA